MFPRGDNYSQRNINVLYSCLLFKVENKNWKKNPKVVLQGLWSSALYMRDFEG